MDEKKTVEINVTGTSIWDHMLEEFELPPFGQEPLVVPSFADA